MKRIFTLFALVALSAGLFAQDCTNLIISEYDEGSGNNKAIEIYNTSDQIIDLGNYLIVRYSNGSTNYTCRRVYQTAGIHSTPYRLCPDKRPDYRSGSWRRQYITEM